MAAWHQLVTAVVIFALATFAAPIAAAGTPSNPEVTDVAGDVETQGAPTPEPIADAVDILSIWVGNETSTTLDIFIHVKDLSATSLGNLGPDSDYIYDARFRVPGLEIDEDLGYWAGRSVLRVDYIGSAWRFAFSPPSTDGSQAEYEDVEGRVDMGSSTIAATIPRVLFGNPAKGDVLDGFLGTAQAVFPAWPIYNVDWAHAPESRSYVLQLGPPDENSSAVAAATIAASAGALPNAGLGITVATVLLVAFSLRRRTR